MKNTMNLIRESFRLVNDGKEVMKTNIGEANKMFKSSIENVLKAIIVENSNEKATDSLHGLVEQCKKCNIKFRTNNKLVRDCEHITNNSIEYNRVYDIVIGCSDIVCSK